MASTKDAFLSDIYDFCDKHNMKLTAFARKFCGSPSFVKELEAGRQPKADTMDRIDAAMIKFTTDMKGVGE